MNRNADLNTFLPLMIIGLMRCVTIALRDNWRVRWSPSLVAALMPNRSQLHRDLDESSAPVARSSDFLVRVMIVLGQAIVVQTMVNPSSGVPYLSIAY